MITSHRGTIAQLVYAEMHHLNFAGIVGDLHALLVRFSGPDLIFEWDCDDIALFDLPTTRIALGWDVRPGKGYSVCLTVSVSSVTKLALTQFGSAHQEMCSRLVERLHGQYPALAILWHQTDECLTADLIDRFVEGLPPAMTLFPFVEPQWMVDELEQKLLHSPVTKQATKAVNELATTAVNRIGRGITKIAADLARVGRAMLALELP